MSALAEKLIRRGLGVPALFLLESSKPLTCVGHQFLIFMQPFVDMMGLYGSEYQSMVDLTQNRERVEELITEIEARL